MRAIRVAVLAFGAVVAAQASLIHQYTFDGNADDSIGTAHGTLSGATIALGFLNLNGTSDHVQFDTHIVPTSGSLSVIVIFNPNATQLGDYQELLSQGFSTGPGFYIGRRRALEKFRASDDWLLTGVPFPLDAVWHIVALVIDASASSSKLYLDGTLMATLDSALATGLGGDHTRFGGQFEAIGEFFGGQLDEVRIYDHALTTAELGIATPEPGTISIAALGSAALLVLARRRRKNELSS